MKPFDILLYVLVVVGWSTSWLPLKWQVGEIAPEVSLVWRFVIAGSLLMIITRLSGRRLALPLWGHGVALTIGLFLFSTNYFFFYTGALVLPSGLLAVVFASASLINLFFSAAVFRTPITPLGLVASALGFAGILLLYWPEIAGQTGSGPSGEDPGLARPSQPWACASSARSVSARATWSPPPHSAATCRSWARPLGPCSTARG